MLPLRLAAQQPRPALTYEEFNNFCGSLHTTTHVVQWGGADVWKVGGKVFAIGGWGEEEPRFTFKTSELSYDILKDQEGPAPGTLPGLAGHEVDPALCAAGPL